MRSLKVALVAGSVLGGACLTASTASAMPIGGFAVASKQLAVAEQNVTWICGPNRCQWRNNYWGPYFGYRRWWGPGYYRGRGTRRS